MRWSADRFYWAVLDTRGLPRPRSRRARDRQLGYILERSLPVPLERVHMVYRRLDGERTLACAIEREQLTSIECLTLAPEALPPFIDAPVDPACLNLLTGEFQPRAIRAANARWRFEVAAAVLLVAAIGALGLFRRADWHQRRGAETRLVLGGVYDEVLDPGPSVLPASLRLTTELRRLEQTRQAPAAAMTPPDAGAALAGLLSHWPSDLELQTESIIVTDAQITVTATVDETSQVQVLADALGNVPGWSLSQPTFHEQRGRVRATVRLGRVAEGAE